MEKGEQLMRIDDVTMFQQLTNLEATAFIRQNEGSDDVDIDDFYRRLNDTVSVDDLIIVIKAWGNMTETEQIDTAIETIGEDSAGKFLALIDYHDLVQNILFPEETTE